MDNPVVKYISMIPKKGFTQDYIKFKKFEFGGLFPGHKVANELKVTESRHVEKLLGIQANYDLDRKKGLSHWDYHQQRIKQSKLVPLPDNAYAEFAKCGEEDYFMPDHNGTSAWFFTKKYGVLGSAGAGHAQVGSEVLFKRDALFTRDKIGIDRFRQEAKEMYRAMFTIAKEGNVSQLKELIEQEKAVNVHVCVEKYKGKYQIVYVPDNLCSALWLQFFHSLISERVAQHGVCLWTGEIFQKTRSDQKFSSASAKAAYNRKYPGGKAKVKAKSKMKAKGGKK